MNWNEKEKARISLQSQLDSAKTSLARNKLGQYATPTELARDILSYGLNLLGRQKEVKFLDPAFGTGSFFSALGFQLSGRKKTLKSATAYEVDEHYYIPTKQFWKDSKLKLKLQDFTTAVPPARDAGRANLLICNPPYVRHHHLTKTKKDELRAISKKVAGIDISGLAGLHVYFLALSHQWLADDGVAGWLVPSEFMDVNYGIALREYLSKKVTLLRVHRFDPKEVQFGDATVSSAIIWYRKKAPAPTDVVEFSYGGTLGAPRTTSFIPVSSLDPSKKWSRLAQKKKQPEEIKGKRLNELFIIKRGIATGNNKFFIFSLSKAKELGIPEEFLRPILPSSRYIETNEIHSDENGWPMIEKRLFLLDCKLPEHEIRTRYPKLWDYLETGLNGNQAVANGYLNRSRKPWYSQEVRSAAPIVCTYMGREKEGRQPFRFLLNHSNAIVGNSYLMLYPKQDLFNSVSPDLIRRVWELLNNMHPEELLTEGRVYGGGLYKLEPKELANLVLKDL